MPKTDYSIELKCFSSDDLQKELDRRKAMVPKPIDDPDIKVLKESIESYFNYLISEGYDEDQASKYQHMLYELMISTLYGPEVWDWINRVTD